MWRIGGVSVTDQVSVAEPSRAPGGRRAIKRRAEIVEAAAGIFAAEGYNNVGMRDVAAAVGIRAASLYHHFSSKEEILFAICLSVARDSVEVNLPLLDLAGTPSERLEKLIGAHVAHLHRRRVEHLVGQHEQAYLTPEHLAEIAGYRRYYYQRVRDLLAAGMQSGEFRTGDPRITALGILNMLNGVSGWIREDRDDPQTIADTFVGLIFSGLTQAP
jgi:AcrR family transcriptional regulator